MGMISSRDTRRISFDNTFSLSLSALAVPKSIEDESIISFDEIPQETTGELMFADKTKYADIPEEIEGGGDYWAHRIENLKKEHQIINKLIEAEYDRQIETTEKKYEPPKSITHEKMLEIQPCFDWRSKIMRCYQENPHQPLVCSPYVQAFTNCVASCRASD